MCFTSMAVSTCSTTSEVADSYHHWLSVYQVDLISRFPLSLIIQGVSFSYSPALIIVCYFSPSEAWALQSWILTYSTWHHHFALDSVHSVFRKYLIKNKALSGCVAYDSIKIKSKWSMFTLQKEFHSNRRKYVFWF